MHQTQRGTIYIEQMHTPGKYYKYPDTPHTEYIEMCKTLNAGGAIAFKDTEGTHTYIPNHNIAELKFKPNTN